MIAAQNNRGERGKLSLLKSACHHYGFRRKVFHGDICTELCCSGQVEYDPFTPSQQLKIIAAPTATFLNLPLNQGWKVLGHFYESPSVHYNYWIQYIDFFKAKNRSQAYLVCSSTVHFRTLLEMRRSGQASHLQWTSCHLVGVCGHSIFFPNVLLVFCQPAQRQTYRSGSWEVLK